MARKKKRFYDSFMAIKSRQGVTAGRSEVVSDWEIQDSHLNWSDNVLNKKKRSRIGHVEKRRK